MNARGDSRLLTVGALVAGLNVPLAAFGYTRAGGCLRHEVGQQRHRRNPRQPSGADGEGGRGGPASLSADATVIAFGTSYNGSVHE